MNGDNQGFDLSVTVAGQVVGLGSAMMRFASAAVPVVVGGMRAITVAMMSNPIGLVVGGIALAAGLVIAYWDEVSGFFQRIWEPVKPYWEGFVSWVGGAVDAMLAPVRAVGVAIDWAMDKAGGAIKVGAEVAGGIARQAPAAAAVGAVLATGTPAPDAQVAPRPAAVAEAAQGRAAAPAQMIVNQTINLTLQGTTTDPRELAQQVARLLKAEQRAAFQGALYDHG
jgi:hypothetical protein